MIKITKAPKGMNRVMWLFEGERLSEENAKRLPKTENGKFLRTYYVREGEGGILFTGLGKREELGLHELREAFAVLAKACKDLQLASCDIDLGEFFSFGESVLREAVLGIRLGLYRFDFQKSDRGEYADEPEFLLYGEALSDDILREAEELATGIMFARDMVNTPGNHLRPMDFARKILSYMEDVETENETVVCGRLKNLKMEALYGIGESSEFPPCLLVLRYRGLPESEEIYGIVGKGVTCDTGGYNLKPSNSMAGIKGDMGGAAAAVGAIHAVAKRRLPVNLTVLLPLAENRISPASHLPGDVIRTFSGKTVEILNVDAEGRLIMSDAMSYGIREEKVTKVIDIATLTGSVWSTLGYTIAGTMSNSDEFYGFFEEGAKEALERYLRFPYGKEHRKMLESKVADIKNIGEAYCGAITAGVFMKEFCEGKPWIHVDIAGTAWSDSPQVAYGHPGATGAGTAALYHTMKLISERTGK